VIYNIVPVINKIVALRQQHTRTQVANKIRTLVETPEQVRAYSHINSIQTMVVINDIADMVRY
jgi:hypothetical protein